MYISSHRSSYPVSNSRPRAGSGPDGSGHDEFDNGRAADGPDAVVDEFNHSRGDSSYNNYDSWSGSGEGSYGGLT